MNALQDSLSAEALVLCCQLFKVRLTGEARSITKKLAKAEVRIALLTTNHLRGSPEMHLCNFT